MIIAPLFPNHFVSLVSWLILNQKREYTKTYNAFLISVDLIAKMRAKLWTELDELMPNYHQLFANFIAHVPL